MNAVPLRFTWFRPPLPAAVAASVTGWRPRLGWCLPSVGRPRRLLGVMLLWLFGSLGGSPGLYAANAIQWGEITLPTSCYAGANLAFTATVTNPGQGDT